MRLAEGGAPAVREGPDASGVRENTEEFNAASGEGPAHRAPSPLERPGIRLSETRLARTGLAAAEFGTVATPAAAASIFYDLIGEADREHFAVLLLDNKHRITHAHIVLRGTAQFDAARLSRRWKSPKPKGATPRRQVQAEV